MARDPTDIFDDLDKLRRTASESKGSGRATMAKRRTPQFVKFPRSWIDRLRSARGATYRVALLLLHQHWKTDGQPIRLPNTALAKEGVERRSKWRALRELEEAGLIRVEARPRKSPIVTILIG